MINNIGKDIISNIAEDLITEISPVPPSGEFWVNSNDVQFINSAGEEFVFTGGVNSNFWLNSDDEPFVDSSGEFFIFTN